MDEIQVTKNVGVDRSSRASQTREKETRRKPWAPPSMLDAPPAPQGYKHRWIRAEVRGFDDRKNIGFDQLIYIEKEMDKYVPITIFNSDGNEVDACGNGSRCVAKLICDEKKIEHTSVLAGNRVLKAQKISDNSFRIVMGDPIFSWQKIPLSRDINHKNINIKYLCGSSSVGKKIEFYDKDLKKFKLPKISKFNLSLIHI